MGGKRGFQTRSNSQVPQCAEIRMARVLSLRSNIKANALCKNNSCFNTSSFTHTRPTATTVGPHPRFRGLREYRFSDTRSMRTPTRMHRCARCNHATDSEGRQGVSVYAAVSSILRTHGVGTSAACRSFPAGSKSNKTVAAMSLLTWPDSLCCHHTDISVMNITTVFSEAHA